MAEAEMSSGWMNGFTRLPLLAALALFIFAGSVRAADDVIRPTRADILFATVDGHPLKLDLYMPQGAANPPLLVWVHGGSWQRGTKEGVDAIDLVRGGYAIASIDYRLSPVAKFPAQVHDIKAAIRYLRARAGEYGYDAARIGIMGSSAGAHLAALAGVTNGVPEYEGKVGANLTQSSEVRVIVSYYGASNLTSILRQSTPYGVGMRVPSLELLLGGGPEAKPELARMASPVFQVDARDPPLLLLHGDQDPQMPINQSHELHGAYQAKGLPVAFEVVHGAVHGDPLFYDAKRTALVKAFLDRYLRAVR
jgi:acetyl esterase/lipase